MNRTWATSELRHLSDLHVLAISNASLELVQAAFDADPEALTEAVVEDAFCCGSSVEILLFLAEKAAYVGNIDICEMLAKRFLADIPLLQSSPANAAEVTEKLKELVRAFPRVLSEQGETCACPLEIVLFSTVFPQDLLDFMIELLPRIELFYVSDNYILPVDDEPFQQQRRTSLDPHFMKSIGAVFGKVEELHIHRNDWKASELSQLLPLICHSTNSIKKLHFDICPTQEVANTWSDPNLIAPAKKTLEDSGGDCSIKEVSISFCGADKPPDFSILSLLLYMKNLCRLDIRISDTWRATQELCDSLRDLLKQGRLGELNVVAVTGKDGLFLPLLDAADKSDTLVDLRLQKLQSQAEVELYQDAILRILDHNTQLEDASICKDDCDSMEARVSNKLWFLDQTEGNHKQRLIDYNTLLNICGRGKAKAEATCLQDLIHMISPQILLTEIDFLAFTSYSKQELITMLQYGLLQQQPAMWSLVPKETKPALKNGSSGKEGPQEQEGGGARKRKASWAPR
ncbi:expressed unknown protein [Seminavis robusta]|uniref:Uncharacterized protein n=1 Tax=Seminavis robusta TaxID=568900 RepID=A0A9N8DG09_9STRA|nr:expressed unknown protein [Seminavis robusta]|eukprot:Sro133_g062930.1 n/a (516) ;mRNA; f:29314-30861